MLELKKCLTYSLEDYIEVIYLIQKKYEVVRLTDVANALSFSKASVNRAMNTLKAENIAIQEKYGKISLTRKGYEIAKKIYEKHRMLSRFFTEVLGVDSQIAEIDACRAEHVLSNETLIGIENFLNKNKV